MPSATAIWCPRSRVHRGFLNCTAYAECPENSCSRAQSVTGTPSKQKLFLASGTVSTWLLRCRAYRRDRSDRLYSSPNLLQRANQPALQSQLHGNLVRLTPQTALSAAENLVHELCRVAVRPSPSRD